MKAKLLKPANTDSGKYTGMTDTFQYNEPVECRWLSSKEKGILVRGSEFIRLGGDTESFLHPDKEYIWGLYEIIEE